MNNPVISAVIKPICWPCSSGVVCKGFLQGRVTAKQSPVTTRLWVLTYRSLFLPFKFAFSGWPGSKASWHGYSEGKERV